MNAKTAVDVLDESFLRDFPRDAAREIERLDLASVVPRVVEQPPAVLARVWHYLLPEVAEKLFVQLPESLGTRLVTLLDPGRAAALLERLGKSECERYLSQLSPSIERELRVLLDYPPDSAGRLMDVGVITLRRTMSAAEALSFLRQARHPGRVRFVFLVDEEGRLDSAVDFQDLALADAETLLGSLAQPVRQTVSVLDPKAEVVARMEQSHLEELPVVDIAGSLLGVIRSEVLLRTLQEDTSADLQTMVGASRDERALSSVAFAARKRVGWMHINLATAFLAASAVSLFEGTIAQFTALAVLMPVVAGMGGNMGAQALAVTLRGLALREITVRHWLRILFKEARVGILNGTIIALTTALAVFLFSQNQGLALVIGLAMVISLSIACVAGALVPIVLTRLGLDPAQSSAIFLTTITDITGFMSFLGIATLLSVLLI